MISMPGIIIMPLRANCQDIVLPLLPNMVDIGLGAAQYENYMGYRKVFTVIEDTYFM